MSDASRQAYARIVDGLSERRRRVYDALEGCQDGATCKVLAALLRWERDSVSPRIVELKRMGLVRETQWRSGGQTVYEVAPADQARPGDPKPLVRHRIGGSVVSIQRYGDTIFLTIKTVEPLANALEIDQHVIVESYA